MCVQRQNGFHMRSMHRRHWKHVNVVIINIQMTTASSRRSSWRRTLPALKLTKNTRLIAVLCSVPKNVNSCSAAYQITCCNHRVSILREEFLETRWEGNVSEVLNDLRCPSEMQNFPTESINPSDIYFRYRRRQMHRAENISAPRNVGHKFMAIESYTEKNNKFINSIGTSSNNNDRSEKVSIFNPC